MGCKTSKDAAQPGQRRPGQGQMSPDRSGAKGMQSPGKNALTNFKEIPEAELKKHKASDIIGFIKSGNLNMVHGLITYYKLGQSVLLLRRDDEFHMTKTEKVSMADWNPLLVAIANKKLDIVRYFLQNLRIALKHAGKRPGDAPAGVDELADSQIFSVRLTIANKDLNLFRELWNDFTAWDEQHVRALFRALVHEHWKEGLNEFFKSYTTEVIYSSLPYEQQYEVIQEWLRVRKEANQDIQKVIDDQLIHKPYSLMTIYTLLKDSEQTLVDNTHKRSFIEKGHLDIHPAQYGHFRYSELYQPLRDAMTAFEAQGEAEKGSITHLSEYFEKTEASFQEETLKGFSSSSEYDILVAKQFDAYRLADLETLRQIVAQFEIRRVPFSEGYNYESYMQELNGLPYYYWSALIHMLHQNRVGEDKMIEVFEFVRTNGFHIRQGLIQTNLKGRNTADAPRIPPILGISLIVSIEKMLYEVYRYLWNENFLNVWGPKHFQMITDLLARQNQHQLIDHHLNSPVGTNLFLIMNQQEKFEFVKNTYQAFNKSYEVHNALSQKYYAPYFILLLTERDTFMKMDDFTFYNQCLENSTQFDLEELSNNKDFEERFIRFLKYVDILDKSDQKKTEGQKLITMIFNLSKLQHLQNVSLQVFDQESIIYEEEGLEERSHKLQIGQSLQAHQARGNIKDLNLKDLFDTFINKDQEKCLSILRNYKLQDVLFYRGLEGSGPFFCVGGQDGFYEGEIYNSQVNIFFLAVQNRFLDVVDYILKDLKVVGSGRVTKNVDPRIVITAVEGDSTAVLRTLMWNWDNTLFFRIWNDYGYLFDEHDMLQLTKAFVWLNRMSTIEDFVRSNTTQKIFLNAHQTTRQSFVDIIRGCDSTTSSLTYYYPYNLTEKYTINEDYLPQIDRLIRDNEFDHLKNLIEGQSIQGLSQVQFDIYQEDEEVLRLADDTTVTLSVLNPILLAIKYKSFACLKYLVDQFGIRQTIQPFEVMVRPSNSSDTWFSFSTLIVPILLKIKDIDSLNFLMKQPGFVLTERDFRSFYQQAFNDKWLGGLKSFFSSPTAQFYFQTLNPSEQKNTLVNIINSIYDVEDVKLRKNFAIGLTEDILTKKPYTKHLAMLMLDGTVSPNHFDIARIAKECLKNLSSEDLYQMYLIDKDAMSDHERRYYDINGSSPQNELAKIVLRYINEGRPGPQERKVRFEGGAQSSSSSFVKKDNQA